MKLTGGSQSKHSKPVPQRAPKPEKPEKPAPVRASKAEKPAAERAPKPEKKPRDDMDDLLADLARQARDRLNKKPKK